MGGGKSTRIMNSLPALDLADMCPEASSELSSTLSVPLIVRDTLVGVLTVYATSEQAFNEHHRQVVEGVAPHVAALLRRTRVFTSSTESALPNYPNARHLDNYMRQRLRSRDQSPFALIVLQLEEHFSHERDVTLLEQVAAFAAGNLRGGDLVFVCGTTTLVCLLADGSEVVAESVRDRLLAFHVPDENTQGRQHLCGFRSAIVRAPRDGETLAELLSAADGIFASIDPPVRHSQGCAAQTRLEATTMSVPETRALDLAPLGIFFGRTRKSQERGYFGSVGSTPGLNDRGSRANGPFRGSYSCARSTPPKSKTRFTFAVSTVYDARCDSTRAGSTRTGCCTRCSRHDRSQPPANVLRNCAGLNCGFYWLSLRSRQKPIRRIF